MNTFDRDILDGTREKLAEIMHENMPIEDWITGTLDQQNRYISQLPEDAVQLFSENGQVKPFASGVESKVFKGITRPSENGFRPLQKGQLANVAVKKPKFAQDFMTDLLLGKQFDYKRDLQGNPLNRVILPHNDYNIAGKGNIASEWMTELKRPQNPTEINSLIKKIKDFNSRLLSVSKGEIPLETFIRHKAANDGIMSFSGKNMLDLLHPVIGKSGLGYLLSDIIANPNIMHNIAQDNLGKLKAIDFLATPIDPGFLAKVRLLLKKW